MQRSPPSVSRRLLFAVAVPLVLFFALTIAVSGTSPPWGGTTTRRNVDDARQRGHTRRWTSLAAPHSMQENI